MQSFSAALPADSDNTAQVFLTPVNDSSKLLIQLNSEITASCYIIDWRLYDLVKGTLQFTVWRHTDFKEKRMQQNGLLLNNHIGIHLQTKVLRLMLHHTKHPLSSHSPPPPPRTLLPAAKFHRAYAGLGFCWLHNWTFEWSILIHNGPILGFISRPIRIYSLLVNSDNEGLEEALCVTQV